MEKKVCLIYKVFFVKRECETQNHKKLPINLQKHWLSAYIPDSFLFSLTLIFTIFSL